MQHSHTEINPLPSLWKTGFRPFFLSGSAFAASWLLLWLLSLFGWFQVGGRMGAALWHSHEMIFGFTGAILAGFLLTAVQNWTGQATARGPLLGTLVALWLIGRIAFLSAQWLPSWLVAAGDLPFLWALALCIARPIAQTKNWRNFSFIVLILGLASTNTLLHLEAIGWIEGWSSRAIRLSIALVLLAIVIVSGRIVPLFTRNTFKKSGHPWVPKRWAWAEWSAFAALAALAIIELFQPPASWRAVLSLLAGSFLLVRMIPWHPHHVLRLPMLWVLHLGCLWLGIGLLWQGVALWNTGSVPSLALHVLMVGAIGTLTLGMMARVPLGHTGREIEAHPLTTIAFLLLTLAVLARVLPPIWLPAHYLQTLALAGTLWSAAFFLYLLIYTPILLQPRADGKPE